MISETEKLQSAHYDRIAHKYAAHYDDKWSRRYREQFINRPLFGNLDVSGKSVLEAMSGTGGITDFLLRQNALVTGLDISATELAVFREKHPQCETICSSVLNTNIESESFDFVVVIGGLHHLHPHLSEAVSEIHRILKPGGFFCFAEPHTNSLPDIIRRQWYKRDAFFVNNEEAIDYFAVKTEFAGIFESRRERFGGNLGYLFVLNSMIFRLPLKLKSVYSPVVLLAESWLEKLQGQKTSCMVTAQWQKK